MTIRVLLTLRVVLWLPFCMCVPVPSVASAPSHACCACTSSPKTPASPCRHDTDSCGCYEPENWSAPANPVINLAMPPVVAVLSWPQIVPMESGAAYSPRWARVHRPPAPATSLLRQHCALVV